MGEVIHLVLLRNCSWPICLAAVALNLLSSPGNGASRVIAAMVVGPPRLAATPTGLSLRPMVGVLLMAEAMEPARDYGGSTGMGVC